MPSAVADSELLARLRADAASGAPEALFHLGAALVARQQTEEALGLYGRAAEAGHPLAQIELARLRLYGLGCMCDPRTAVGWLLRAEQAGDAVASYLLAQVAIGGIALPRDARINARVQAAANAGFAPALRAAAIHFGRKPHPDDQTLCLQLLERAAAQGDAVSALLLAERLANGEGCPPDPGAADDLFAQLQRQGISRLPVVSAATPTQHPAPPRTLALEDALMAPATAVLAAQPRVATVGGLLSTDECRLLIATARPQLRDSATVDPASGQALALPLRTSSDCSFDPILEDLALRLVQLRIATAAGIDLPQAEQLIVLRYTPGQEYRPHRDYLPAGAIARDRPQAGNRARSICVYLNDVAAGGATAFPFANLLVSPRAGTAVVFDNLRADGSPDPASLHAGQPVERGEKWLATLWLRQHRYRDY